MDKEKELNRLAEAVKKIAAAKGAEVWEGSGEEFVRILVAEKLRARVCAPTGCVKDIKNLLDAGVEEFAVRDLLEITAAAYARHGDAEWTWAWSRMMSAAIGLLSAGKRRASARRECPKGMTTCGV